MKSEEQKQIEKIRAILASGIEEKNNNHQEDQPDILKELFKSEKNTLKKWIKERKTTNEILG